MKLPIIYVADPKGLGIRDPKRGGIRTITVGEGDKQETVKALVRGPKTISERRIDGFEVRLLFFA